MTAFDGRTVQKPKSLMTTVFTAGISQSQFGRLLQDFGYGEDPDRAANPNEVWYRKGGNGSFPCSSHFLVEGKFDETGLREALAIKTATCL